jgi:hypothetical protein
MADLIKTLSENIWKFVYAWVLPACIAVGTFVLLVFPALEDVSVFHGLVETTNRNIASRSIGLFLICLAIALVLALLLALNSTPLYRLLEGYAWPKWAFEAGRKRQIDRWKKLKETAFSPTEERDNRARQQIAWGRLKEYPEDEKSLLPSRLGNAIKAFESYGNDRYGLDSQTLWYELTTVAPDNLRKDEQEARSIVDFFVCSIYLSAAYTFLAILIGIAQQDLRSFITGLVAALLVPFTYSRAVKSTQQWRSVVQALVNIGRINLARSLNLRIPPILEDEKRMWQAFTGFVYWGHEEYVKQLEEFRMRADDTDRDTNGEPGTSGHIEPSGTSTD